MTTTQPNERQSDSARLKFPQDAQEIFARAEAARDQGRLEDAARLFGRSAAKWGASGKVIQAANAYFELGAILLLQGRGRLLPDLADRLLEHLKASPLPSRSRLRVRVFAALLRRGASNQTAILHLVVEQRRHREARWRDEEANPGSEDPEADSDSLSRWAPASDDIFLEMRFAMSTRRESVAFAGRLEAEARSLDCPIRCIIDETHVTAWIPATDEGWKMASVLEEREVALTKGIPVE